MVAAACADGAAVGHHDAVRDEEPEAGAPAGGAPPELREHPLRGLRPDAGAFVGDADPDAAFVRAHRDRDCAVAVADRVLHDVADDLVELVRVGPDLRKRTALVNDELLGRLPCREPTGNAAAYRAGHV